MTQYDDPYPWDMAADKYDEPYPWDLPADGSYAAWLDEMADSLPPRDEIEESPY